MKGPENSAFNLRRLMQTPTLAFTASGILCVVLWVFRIPFSDVAAFVFFLLAGGGVAMALGSEVRRKGFNWGWKGVLGAVLYKPSKEFKAGFIGHLPQLLAALAIAIIWRSRRKKD